MPPFFPFEAENSRLRGVSFRKPALAVNPS
jgi:hypothetical protein